MRTAASGPFCAQRTVLPVLPASIWLLSVHEHSTVAFRFCDPANHPTRPRHVGPRPLHYAEWTHAVAQPVFCGDVLREDVGSVSPDGSPGSGAAGSLGRDVGGSGNTRECLGVPICPSLGPSLWLPSARWVRAATERRTTLELRRTSGQMSQGRRAEGVVSVTLLLPSPRPVPLLLSQ
jgi:hypothetical protein